MNVQETLPILLRLLDPQELAKYNGMTPTTLDFLGNYADGVDSFPYVLDVGGDETIVTFKPAAFGLGSTESLTGTNVLGTRPKAFFSLLNNILAHDMNRIVGNIYDPRPRGYGN